MIARAAALILAITFLTPATAAVRRLILFKFDGLNAQLVDDAMRERDERTGRSRLPWMTQLFAEKGVRLDNFYVRGISLSAPSWSMLDSGEHQVIRGNVEYDRWTLLAYDYLNFFPFYFNYAEKHQTDMPGVEVLDDAGIPLLLDAFDPAQRWQSYQLYQRGNRWSVLRKSLPHHFRNRSPKDWFDEWQTGFELEGSISQEMERELMTALADDQIRYVDCFSGDYDHVAHLTTDRASQLRALQSLDALIGRIWTAAMASKLAQETMIVVVSDHGMNTTPGMASQGYSLVEWFNSLQGGAHHVVTDRFPLSTFRLRSLDPFVHRISNPSPDSLYLKGEAERYPTVLLDVDGNERAAVQLRSNAWNIAQILLLEANRAAAAPAVKSACRRYLEQWAARERQVWAATKARFSEELDAVEQIAESQADRAASESKQKWSEADWENGRALSSRRSAIQATKWKSAVAGYREFTAAYDSFLAMPPDARPNLVPATSLGNRNTLYDLQNYVAGPGSNGVVLNAAGDLDPERSFRRIDYLDQLTGIRLRNQVDARIGNQPVDFVAVSLDTRAVESAFNEGGLTAAVLLHRDTAHQALVLYRESSSSGLEIRYLPIARLHAQADGLLRSERCPWAADFPLSLYEDSALGVASADRKDWLSRWHGEDEWFEATHKTRYSNGVIGLYELFRPLSLLAMCPTGVAPADCERFSEWRHRRRELVQPDLEIFASDHWNFNVRNFNPGGNHGAFLQPSTRSVLMFSGGADSGIPQGLEIEKPYDSLSFVPTIFELMGLSTQNRLFPGHPIRELTQGVHANETAAR